MERESSNWRIYVDQVPVPLDDDIMNVDDLKMYDSSFEFTIDDVPFSPRRYETVEFS